MHPIPEAPSSAPMWTCRDVARFLRRSPRWVSYALCRPATDAGSIPHYRLPGGGPRFDPAEIRDWMQAGCPPAADFRPKPQATHGRPAEGLLARPREDVDRT